MKISNREKEVLHLIAQEYTTNEIAQQLYISAHTVISHRKNLLWKMDARNVAGLVRRGFEKGILSVSANAFLLLFFIIGGFSAQIGAQTTIEPDYILSGRDQLPINGESISDTFILIDPVKGAIRGGYLRNETYWSPDSIGLSSISWGYNTLASGDEGATALGNYTTASGDFGATALGYGTTASGDEGATALGQDTEARGEYGATAMGVYSQAIGDYGATALGGDTEASGNDGATALGFHTLASGEDGATALGRYTTASGEDGATALGAGTHASGINGSTALGADTEASGVDGSTALGYETISSGSGGATAIGYNSKTSGDDGSTAIGYYAHSTGNNCVVVGRFNDTIVASGKSVTANSPLFIVGNGDAGSNKSNALVVRKNGHITIKGDTSNSQADMSFTSRDALIELGLGEEGPHGFAFGDETNGQGLKLLYRSTPNQLQIETGTNFGNENPLVVFDDQGYVGIGIDDPDENLVVKNNIKVGESLLDGNGICLIGTCTSDRNLKTNISSLSSQLALILALRPTAYHWREDKDTSSEKDIGLIAQEVEEVIPDMVVTDEDGTKKIKYDISLQIRMIKAMQEQQEMIEAQQRKIDHLLKEVHSLKNEK